MHPRINPKTGRPGPAPGPIRDGDKAQARQRTNHEVNNGRLPHPNTLPCHFCRHVFEEGGTRHEYHHHNGYGAAHQLDVVPACAKCHHQNDDPRASATHCIHGHEFNAINTIIKSNGARACRECRRAHDRKRPRNAEFWRNYRMNKKQGTTT